jgi:type IV secretion system protein VirD4
MSMNGRTKILVGALASAGVAGLAVGGQYAGGALFAHMEHLPQSVVGIFTLRDYWHAYGDVKAVKKALGVCTFASVAVPIAPIALACVAVFSKPKRELHGSARWARDFEIRQTGLLSDDSGRAGIILGKYKGRYLTFVGQQFVMIAAPTRSGKGVAIVIPNLLTYPDSVVVLDLKFENYRFTSGYRAKYGQKVFLWAPFAEDGKTHGWNVFDTIVKRAPHLRIGDVQAIGQKFYSSNVEARTKFWNDLARNLFVGLVLYLMETATPERPCTLSEVFRQSSGMGRPVKEHIAALKATPGLSMACTNALNRFLSSSDEVLNSILSTFNAPLLIFDNPVVDAATSHSSFDINEVRRQRMTIYLGIQPNRLEDAALLVNLFFSQLIDLNTSVLPEHDPSLKYQCLLVMDEFTAIGRVNIIDKANAFIAGYNLRLLIIIQSISQMEPSLLYGKEGTRTLVNNMAAKIIYPPKDQEESKVISETLGYLTESSVSTGKTRGKNLSRSENASDQRRALMMPQELAGMPQKQEILLGFDKPILCEKAYYYSDPLFINRLKEISPSLRALGKKMPSEQQLKDAAGLETVKGNGIYELSSTDVPSVDISAWMAKREASTAAKGPNGERVVRASDLAEMDPASASITLVKKAAARVDEDVFALTGIRFNFSDLVAQRYATQSVTHDAAAAPAISQEVFNG